MTTVSPLAPDVIERLKQLQDSDRNVTVDEILTAANLNHLVQPSVQPEKSVSSSLAERRRLPVSPEKLKLCNQITTSRQLSQDMILKRLEEENAKLPPQASEDYLLAHLERQNALLNADPKSICIQSNRLQADFNTVRNLVTDATFSPTQETHQDESLHSMLSVPSINTDEVADWDFWQAIVEDFPTAASKLPHLLAAKLSCGGIPHPIRGLVWQSMAQSSSLQLESVYTKLAQESEKSPYERIIQRDLSRTFPQLEMFKTDGGEGQQAMGRLLKAYSIYDDHLGYCQGLAFLVGPLLMTMSEEQAFCVFVRLMENYDMRTMFTLNMEGLHLRLFQFQTLLAQLCPQLDQHLSNHNIHAQMYGSPWFLTLFAYSFPISLVLRIYDLVFAEGAVETITRVAIAVMQKNEAALLEINEFENLMLYLGSRKLYEEGYASDPEAVIRDTMSLSTIITRQKMESISENYHKEAEQEKNRAHQLVALRFGGWGKTSSKKSPSSKRDSWFPWSGEASATTATATETTVSEHPDSSLPATIPLSQDPTVSVLHEQIEDLVTALSQLQKDHTQLSEQMMTKQMSEMDLMNERNILLKKNRMLEKQITQHAAEGNTIQQPSPVESEDGDPMHERLASLQKEEEFRGFVDSLKLSGDFGALIAGALSGGNDLSHEVTVPAYNGDTKPLDTVSSKSIEPMDDSTMDDITSELVNIKLANFEMGLKHQTLCQDYEMMKQSLKNTQEGQGAILTKMMTLQTTIESLQIDKERLLQEKDELLEHHEELNQKALASKKTCADIQLEKMGLDKENERLCHRVKELEDQRTEYLMPRGSFTEEVFAAHQTLFGNEAPAMSRRHTVQMIPKEEDVYQSKYIESDLRCRELEKLLAETKFKLVEHEATSPTSSPRVSLQQNKRPTSLQTKRSSTLSVFSKNPTSPTQDQQQFARESTDSLRSTNSASSNHQKRSSVYSRFLNVLGSGSTPLPEETNEDKLTDEEHA